MLRWKLRQLLGNRPLGSLLFIELTETSVMGDEASANVRWSFRSPGETAEGVVTHAEGEAALAMRNVESTWRVTNIEQLVEVLHRNAGLLAARE